MFGRSGTVVPERPNIYSTLVDIWVNFGWSDWLRAAMASQLTNFMALSYRAYTGAVPGTQKRSQNRC
jgi:hypothetical protein